MSMYKYLEGGEILSEGRKKVEKVSRGDNSSPERDHVSNSKFMRSYEEKVCRRSEITGKREAEVEKLGAGEKEGMKWEWKGGERLIEQTRESNSTTDVAMAITVTPPLPLTPPPFSSTNSTVVLSRFHDLTLSQAPNYWDKNSFKDLLSRFVFWKKKKKIF